MKIKNKILHIIFVVFMIFWTNITYAYTYNCHWHYRVPPPLYMNTSVTNGSMQWTGWTKYSNAWYSGINTWNNEGEVAIGYINSWWLADLEVKDVYKNVIWAGRYTKTA